MVFLGPHDFTHRWRPLPPQVIKPSLILGGSLQISPYNFEDFLEFVGLLLRDLSQSSGPYGLSVV